MLQNVASWLTLIVWLLGTAFAYGDGENAVLTGTVNVVLANQNGIVAITDSYQTEMLPNGEPITAPLPGQKLFVIDERTVCTIAGFGATPFPNFPEFDGTAAGVIDRFTEELRRTKAALSFHEKLAALQFLFDFQLSAIGNLKHLDAVELGQYDFSLLLAGYDTDGTEMLGKIAFAGSMNRGGIFRPLTKTLTETVVGRELRHETAGIGSGDVENVLQYPTYLRDEPEIGKYVTSMAKDRGASLTAIEIEALAVSLAHHSAKDNRHTYLVIHPSGRLFDFRQFSPIGGRDQVAVLEKGSVTRVMQPVFADRPLNSRPFSLVAGFSIDSAGRSDIVLSYSPAGGIILFVKDQIVGFTVLLDGTYFFEDDFRNVTFIYDGGVLGFDRSNRVTNCVLHLGKRVNRDDPAIKELIQRFPWNEEP